MAVLFFFLWGGGGVASYLRSFVVELCQARQEAGAPSREMVAAFLELQKVYEGSINRDPYLDEVSDRFRSDLILV